MYDECDVLKWYREDLRVARKEHRCEECWRKIHVGERYVACHGCSDDGVFTAKQHMRCYHFARHVNHDVKLNGDGNHCIPFGEIQNALEEFAHGGCPIAEELLYQWWFIKRGAEFKPVIETETARDFQLTHPGKDL